MNRTPDSTRRARAWQERAACVGADPEWFFSPDPIETAAARSLCSSCPVKSECLAHAESTPESAGVWGGVDLDERHRAARRAMSRPRRSRKATAVVR